MYQTPDMEAQGQLFNEIAELVEKAKLRSTLTNPFSPTTQPIFELPMRRSKAVDPKL
jgi:hypothetical protein